MKIINTKDKDFKQQFEEILGRGKVDIKSVTSIVQNIIDEIIQSGNEALKQHISKFDNWTPKSDEELFISQDDMKKAYENIDEELRDSLHLAYDRIKSITKNNFQSLG